MQSTVLALVSKYMPGHLRPSGGSNVLTKCPFHKGGQETKPSFSINLEKGLFHCFTGDCGVSGNIEKLLRLLQVPESLVKAEVELIKPLLDTSRKTHQLEKTHTFLNRDPFKADYILPESIMGAYRFCPMMLVEAGYSQELLQHMEIGYDISQNRIMYPLRDMYGNLAGFSGGATPLTLHSFPKYKVYQGRRKGIDGRWLKNDFGDWFDQWFPEYRCENHDFLWNFHRIWARRQKDINSVDTIYVAEGFKACMWMINSGFINTVALMGSYISDRQQQMLHRTGCNIVLCLDNDRPGRAAALKVADLLWKPMYGKVRVIRYPDEDKHVDTQPDDYETESLQWMVNNSRSYFDHINTLRKEQQL